MTQEQLNEKLNEIEQSGLKQEIEKLSLKLENEMKKLPKLTDDYYWYVSADNKVRISW